MNRKMTVLLVLAALSSLVACKNVGLENDKAVSGDKIYIPSGYKQKLAEMNLSEVAALPYFTLPFVTVAKNSKGEQHAVLFQSSDEAQDVKLPLPYEEIISRFQSAGFTIDSSSVGNVHLFKNDNKLVWSYNDGSGTCYLSLEGYPIDPFSKTN